MTGRQQTLDRHLVQDTAARVSVEACLGAVTLSPAHEVDWLAARSTAQPTDMLHDHEEVR